MDNPLWIPQMPTEELVQSPATTATATAPHHQEASFPWPSTEHQRDIAALSSLSDFEILSKIALLRSIATRLTDQQLAALVCLRSAPDDHIARWLDYGRGRGYSGGTIKNLLGK